MTGSTDNGWIDDPEYDNYHRKWGWSKNLNAPKGVHIMNKNERKALNKLKRETGLNEVELRKEKTFRKVLSEAQKAKGTKDDYDRRIINIVKGVTRRLKLAIDHPLVKEEIKKSVSGYTRWPWFRNEPSVENVISHYKQLRKKQKEK